MSKAKTPPRAICLRQTDENFFLAVDKPYERGNGDYIRLLHLVPHATVYELKEGSQVFVYPREEFDPLQDEAGESKLTDAQLFSERVFLSAHWMGSVLIDPSVEEVADRVVPNPADFIKS